MKQLRSGALWPGRRLFLAALAGLVFTVAATTARSEEQPELKHPAVDGDTAAFPSTQLPPLAPADNPTTGGKTASGGEGALSPAQEQEPGPGASRPDPVSSAVLLLNLDGDLPSTSGAGLSLHERLHWSTLGGKKGHTLNDVLQIAARANPNWGTFAANHAAAHAEVIAASVYPNPEIEGELGRARAREADEEGNRPSTRVWSLALSQPIEMPGKRLARRLEAEAGFGVVAGETLEFNSTLRAEVVEAYYTVHYYTALVRLHDTLREFAERMLRIANLRIDLGVAGTIERVNARVALLRTQRELAISKRQMLGAKAALNALTGGALGTRFELAGGLKENFPEFGRKETLRTAMQSHPRLFRLAAELEQRYASLDRARTEWWPDLRLGAQKTKELDSESVAITAGIEIPLWNRNQGGIARAEAEAQSKYNDILIALNELRRDAEVAWQNYQIARERVGFYTDGLKEAAQEALEIAALQYSEGAAGYLDLLSARQTLQETEQEYLEALYNAALAQAQLERARGTVIRCEPGSGKKAPRRR